MCEKISIHEEIIKGQFSVGDSIFYIAAINGSGSAALINWCKKGIESLTTESWTAQFNDKEHGIKLTLKLIEKGNKPQLNTQYSDAITLHATSLMALKLEISENDKEIWQKLMSCLELSVRKVMHRRVIEAAMKSDGDCSNSFFDLYGEEILDKDALLKNAEIVEKLYSPLVEKESIGGLTWLIKALELNPTLDGYPDTDAVNAFKDRIGSEVRNESDENSEFHNLILNLASVLNLKMEKAKTDN